MKTSWRKAPVLPIRHEFVEFIPERLNERTLYVSTAFASAAHLCFCGCGNKVVTPIHPTGWELLFDGDTVSLHPSIGNWGFHCRSHYWVVRDRVIWARPMSDEKIVAGRSRDRRMTETYFSRVLSDED
jgi:hypothetical protein